jgi:hypothetical protein
LQTQLLMKWRMRDCIISIWAGCLSAPLVHQGSCPSTAHGQQMHGPAIMDAGMNNKTRACRYTVGSPFQRSCIAHGDSSSRTTPCDYLMQHLDGSQRWCRVADTRRTRTPARERSWCAVKLRCIPEVCQKEAPLGVVQALQCWSARSLGSRSMDASAALSRQPRLSAH